MFFSSRSFSAVKLVKETRKWHLNIVLSRVGTLTHTIKCLQCIFVFHFIRNSTSCIILSLVSHMTFTTITLKCTFQVVMKECYICFCTILCEYNDIFYHICFLRVYNTAGCECLPGWTGLDCSLSCSPGRYGPRCLLNCACSNETSKGCHPVTGQCRCSAGYSGHYCDNGINTYYLWINHLLLVLHIDSCITLNPCISHWCNIYKDLNV